jgi:hypothetical protein
MKNDATPEQLVMFAKYVLGQFSENNESSTKSDGREHCAPICNKSRVGIQSNGQC